MDSTEDTSPPPSSDDSQEHIDVSSTVRGRGRGRGRARGRGRGRGRHTTTEARPTSSNEALLNIEQRKVTLRAMIEQMNDTEKNDQLLKIIENQPSLVFNLAVPQPQQPGVGGYHPSESSSKPDWCVCTFCREMPTQPERKCCDRPHEFCMSQSPDLRIFCLNEGSWQ
ncbi:uncharacterized protein [Ptychodera flava]|uniref:uncharacterized protein n=1 Tax=Ptychodera flava TaxID=63121 RepID=UPI003969CE6E